MKDDHEVTKFWNFAKTFDKATLKENEVFALGQGVYFLGEVDFGSRLFVRECYLELLDLVLSGGKNVLLRGTPGIGMTHFSFVLILRLISEGKQLYTRGGMGWIACSFPQKRSSPQPLSKYSARYCVIQTLI